MASHDRRDTSLTHYQRVAEWIGNAPWPARDRAMSCLH
jgi:hypothetical protein